MANEVQTIAQQQLGQLPAAVRARVAAGGKINSALSAGITSGFAVISFRGKVFRIKHLGEERPLLNQDNQPMPSMDVVIVKPGEAISKIFYIDGYEEGSNAPPDCWSVNGVAPDPASPKRQNPTCAGCPQNAWGSASRNGRTSKGKACSDSKRLGVVPSGNIPNEMYGGPMLVRVPPDSLGELRAYAERLNMMGFPVEAVVTRLSFDYNTPHPKILFKEVRALNDEEYAEVEKHLKGEVIDRILNTAIDHVQTDGPVNEAPAPLPPVGGKPVQQPQQAPAGFIPQVVGGKDGAGQPLPPHDPKTGEFATVATSPAAASVERVAEVEKAQTGDPNKAKRQAMRSMGLSEEQIIAALGPEPKEPEPEEDPRIAAMRALGLSDEQIHKALGITPAGNAPAPATPAQPVQAAPAPATPAQPATRKRRSKAEIEADEAAKKAAAQPKQTAPTAQTPPARPPANAGSAFGPQPTQPLNGEVLPPESAPEAANDEPAADALPPGFEDQLDNLLGLK